MKILPNGLLPFDGERLPCGIRGGCSLVGDRRGDENIALHSMHTLWVREHNRIAKELTRMNKHWDEHVIFETARKIVGAQFQHIIYEEWLPKITRLPRFKKYNQQFNPAIANAFATAAFRFGHSLIPNMFTQLNANFDEEFKPVTLQNAFRNRVLISRRGIEPTMFGLLGNKSNPIDTGLAFGIARRLFVRPGKRDHMDLSAFNIQRGRDHGIPTYGKWRQFCQLPRVRTFNDLRRFMFPDSVKAFRRLYKNPNDIDLFAAGLAELHAPGSIVGPTFRCIIRHQFLRLRDGDRFFYQRKESFTGAQRKQLQKGSMARVLCDNLRYIVSIQPKAFDIADENANRRIECSRLPKIDLSKWKFNFIL